MKSKIETQKFVDSLLKYESGYIFLDDTVFRFIVDTLNKSGIDAELRYQDTEYSIVVLSEKAYIAYSSDDPQNALLEAVRMVSDEINSSKTLQAWYAYSHGEHFLCIEERKQKGHEEEVDQAIS